MSECQMPRWEVKRWKSRVHAIAHEQQCPEPQHPHLGDRQPRREVEQHANEKNTASPANSARLGRESLRSMSGRTEPSEPAMVTATRFSGAITSAASVKVASEPATIVPTTIWVGEICHGFALRLAAGAARRRTARRLPTPHQIRGHAGVQRGAGVWTSAAVARHTAGPLPACGQARRFIDAR